MLLVYSHKNIWMSVWITEFGHCCFDSVSATTEWSCPPRVAWPCMGCWIWPQKASRWGTDFLAGEWTGISFLADFPLSVYFWCFAYKYTNVYRLLHFFKLFNISRDIHTWYNLSFILFCSCNTRDSVIYKEKKFIFRDCEVWGQGLPLMRSWLLHGYRRDRSTGLLAPTHSWDYGVNPFMRVADLDTSREGPYPSMSFGRDRHSNDSTPKIKRPQEFLPWQNSWVILMGCTVVPLLWVFESLVSEVEIKASHQKIPRQRSKPETFWGVWTLLINIIDTGPAVAQLDHHLEPTCHVAVPVTESCLHCVFDGPSPCHPRGRCWWTSWF